jgi:hypothetical protein
MRTQLGGVRDELAAIVAALDPDGVPLTEAPALWADFDGLERLGRAGKVLLARRVDESRAWHREGYRSAAEYLAVKGGASVGEARRELQSSEKLGATPAAERALRRGRLSGAQAASIIDAAAANPAAEGRLVRGVERWSHTELRDECARVKAAADPDPDQTYRRIHADRRLRTFTDAEGAWNLHARGTIDAGARLQAALEPIIEEHFRAGRTSGTHEPREAYAFDALVELAGRTQSSETKSSRRTNPNYRALLRIDLEALRRGAVEGEERCEITGVGPVPVRVARELLSDAVLELVITKGVGVANVTHLGRGPSAAQRVALAWASPTCIVEHCNGVRVEIDHRIPFAETHHTVLGECDPLCCIHHDRKTYEGWALVEGMGKRPMVPPDDPRHPKNAARASDERAPPDAA